MTQIRLGQIAIARSGDKGSGANIGIIARTPRGFDFLRDALTASTIEAFFKPLGVGTVIRYELANLGALNFILPAILDGGGSVSMRIDAQGKALGQILLEMPLDVPDDLLPEILPKENS
jgi:hypothetical protein